MEIKEFFALDEMALHEMAGMPKDNPFNGFMYKMIMKKYGHKYAGKGGAWPLQTSYEQKVEDVTDWFRLAAKHGITPSREGSPRSIVAALDWPFGTGAGTKSPNAAQNMRALAVQVGFATQEQMDALFAKEGQKADAAPKASASMPKTRDVIRQKAAQPLRAEPDDVPDEEAPEDEPSGMPDEDEPLAPPADDDQDKEPWAR